jgi:tetratricopeptide (TPR) repeat protein
MIFEKAGDNKWCYKESKRLKGVFDSLLAAEELKEAGYIDEAVDEFRKIIKKVPECVEAYNDLYVCHLYLGNDFEAFSVLESAVNLFLPLIPKVLFDEKHCIPWGFLENRPFMRLYANLGGEYKNRKRFAEAKVIFDRLLKWNPNDNQGVRENALLCDIELKLFNEALELCHHYPEDIMPGILYGRPFLLVILGNEQGAKKELEPAIKYCPKVAEELLKSTHRPPKNLHEGYITVGGDDEAYFYWKDFGKYWEQTPAAIKLLADMIQKIKA